MILTHNYGKAGAIDRYGEALGLPSAYSGHNAYAEWGPPPDTNGPVILVGEHAPALLDSLFDCHAAAGCHSPLITPRPAERVPGGLLDADAEWAGVEDWALRRREAPAAAAGGIPW